MGKTTYGQVEITLGDETYTLKPTLKAFETIEARFGGLRAAIDSVKQMSLGAATAIIAAGTGVGRNETKELKQAIMDEGLINVMPQITDFLMKLLNPTGKNDDDEDESSGEE
jgi:hypothetical protein